MRFMLIFLVVFGHMLELCQGQLTHVVYQLIYSFHMPAFIFITGYFAKFKSRTVLTLAGCYVLFQTLYVLFSWAVLNGCEGQLTLQYAEPYWLMWYLMATVFYYLLVPLLAKARGNMRMVVVVGCVIVSALSGYLPVSRFLTLARLLAFLPFFVAGYYAHERMRSAGEQGGPPSDLFAAARKPVTLVVACVAAVGGFALLQGFGVSNEVLYCASSYAMSWSNPLIRVAQLVTASGFVVLLLAATGKSERVAFVTRAGQNTMPVFLLHGFIVRMLGKAALVPLEGVVGIIVSLVVACALTFALGQPALNALLRFKPPRKKRKSVQVEP